MCCDFMDRGRAYHIAYRTPPRMSKSVWATTAMSEKKAPFQSIVRKICIDLSAPFSGLSKEKGEGWEKESEEIRKGRRER